MPTDRPKTPERLLSKTDKGDDIQRRFRYQAAYAAIISLDLLNENPVFDELFCEHHEDILCKRNDSTFVGIQVKTREVGQEPFKASDSEITNSLKRFMEHEKEFPRFFSRYVLATNCGFWHKSKNSTNFPHLLELAKASKNNATLSSERPLSAYMNKLSITTGSSSDLVLDVLNKVEIESNLPKLDDIERRLIHLLGELPGMGNRTHIDLKRVAKSLIDTMFHAASLSHDSPKRDYFALLSNPKQKRDDAIIQGKRITKEIVQRILQESLPPNALLMTYDHVPLSELPRGMRRMELKLAAGNISISNIELMMDNKYSAEVLFLKEWLYKHGPRQAEDRYRHLSVVVRNECQEAHDSALTAEGLFGQKMLDEVRHRLRTRHTRDKESLFDCSYEHLLGIAGVLTEECKLWWSDVFEISEEHRA